MITKTQFTELKLALECEKKYPDKDIFTAEYNQGIDASIDAVRRMVKHENR